MENYQMSRPGCRPYNRTCGMTRPGEMPGRMPERMPDRMRKPDCMPRKQNCNCRMPGTESKDAEMYSHLHHFAPAMAYVPCQELTETFEPAYGLRVGTIFPELCKPFCGKRGNCR